MCNKNVCLCSLAQTSLQRSNEARWDTQLFICCCFFFSPLFILGLGSSVYQISRQNPGNARYLNQLVKSLKFWVRSRFPNLPARLRTDQRMKTLSLKAAYLLHLLPALYPHQCQLDRLHILLILKEPPSLSPYGCATATANGYLSPLRDQSRERRGERESLAGWLWVLSVCVHGRYYVKSARTHWIVMRTAKMA